ncbi:hypothetical protein J6590_040587 [Homalodisca vitripennis]|nr:hypothetical protein J6590_040587 [Homalodisca vitripennis]
MSIGDRRPLFSEESAHRGSAQSPHMECSCVGTTGRTIHNGRCPRRSSYPDLRNTNQPIEAKWRAVVVRDSDRDLWLVTVSSPLQPPTYLLLAAVALSSYHRPSLTSKHLPR